MAVAAIYDFRANYQVLERVAKAAEQASAALESVTRVMRSFNSAAATTMRRLDGMQAAIGKTAVGFDEMGVSADRAAAQADAGMATIRKSIALVTAQANGAAAAVRRIGGGIPGTPGGGGGRGASGSGGGGIAGALGNVAKFGSLAGLATAAIGVRGAANFQDASIQTGIPLGKSNEWVDQNLRPLAMRMSQQTAQSITDSMSLLRTMATAGINNPKDLTALAPTIANFADTQYLGKFHVPFDESAGMVAKLSHQLNLRTADQLNPFTNTLWKLSQDMPDNIKTAATQIGYYGNAYAAHGVDPSEILKIQATADRLGFGSGKSGTGLNMILNNLQKPTLAQARAQGALGMLDANGQSRFIDQRTGQFNPEALFSYINQKYDAARKSGTVGAFNTSLAGAFTTNAARLAGAFGSDAGRTQRANVELTMKRVQDLQVAQARLMDSLNHQTKLLTSNFQTLATLLAGPWIEPLTRFVSKLASITGGAASFLQENPAALKIGSGLLAIVAAAGAYEAYKLLGGARLFLHAAAHTARESIGVGAFTGRLGGEAGHLAESRIGVIGRVGEALQLVFPWAERFGAAIRGIVPRILLTVPFISEVGTLIGRFGLKAIPVVGNVLLLIDAFNLLKKHSFDIGHAIGKAAAWIEKTGGPLLATAIESAFQSAITGLIHGIIPFVIDTAKSNVMDVLGIKHQAMGADAALDSIFNPLGAGYNAGRYGIDPGQIGGAPGYLMQFDNMKPKQSGPTIVNVQNMNLPSVRHPKDFAAALHSKDFRGTNSRQGAVPTSPFVPTAMLQGLGAGH